MTDFPHALVSADSHIVEPPDLWVERIEKKYRARAPHTVMGYDGQEGEFFVAEGLRPWFVARQFAAGIKGEDMPKYVKNTFAAAPPSVWDPAARLKEQDIDGIQAEVLYATFGMFLYGLEDGGLREACFRAYNDYVADYCSHDRERLVGVGVIALDDISGAVGELERCAKKGLRGAMIWSRPPEDKPYYDRHYDPFWAAAQDLGMVLSMHVHSGRSGMEVDPARWLLTYTTLTVEIQRSLSELILYGVLEHFPKLQVVSAENDCGWVPHLMYRLDHAYEEFRFVAQEMRGVRLSMRPGEYLKRNVLVTFQHEKREAAFVREFLGAERLMWGSDYPHTDGTWPRSREILARALTSVPGEDVQKMVGGNAARLYGITLKGLHGGTTGSAASPSPRKATPRQKADAT